MADDANETTTDELPVDAEAVEGGADADEAETPVDAADGAADDADDAEADEAAAPVSEAKKKADAVIAERRAKSAAAAASTGERKVERRVVTSRRVTPKAGAKPEKADAPVASSKARDAKKTEAVVSRTPPVTQPTYAKGPSPWWVPALMFGLIIVGALVIMLNYMGAFGEPDNIRLVIGLALILGGIITATQYR
jgi:hypothetical protein